MKNLLLLFGFISFMTINGLAQEIKKDVRPQILKEDEQNLYKTDQISELDILQALEFAGIRVYKFNLGQFDKKYIYYVMTDEYLDGKIVNTDTLIAYYNDYHYYQRGTEDYFLDYIDQIKIFTKEEENKLKLNIRTYAMSTKKELKYEKKNDKQFYNLRRYINSSWILDKKIPLLVYASSWEDKKYGFQRFCGASELEENDKDTEELLSSSPHYFLISYKVVSEDNE